MSKFEFFTAPILVIIFSLSILWLTPKKFSIDMAAGKLFRDLTRFRPVSKEICEMVTKFKEEMNKSYHKELAIFSILYLIFVGLYSAFIYWVIFQKG